MGSYWQELFRVGRGAIGLTLFFVLAGVGIFMFLVGRFQEKLGTRVMITIGAVVCGLDVVLIGYASQLFTLYLWAFLMGTASSFILIPALTTVQKWFPARRGLVSGIVNFMFAFSAAVMSPVFHFMFNSMGYSPMCVALAIIALVIGVVAAQFTEMPATAAIPAPPPQGESSGSQPALAPSLTLGESIRTRSLWFFWLTWAFQGAAGIAMVTLSTQYGLSLELSLGSAVIILTAFNITNGLSRLLMGHLSDIVGRNAAMSVTFLAAAGAYFVLPHVSGVVIPAVVAAIIGFAFGTLFAVSAPLATDCFGLQHFGSIFGVIFTAYGFVAGPLGPWLSGYLLDATGGNFVLVFSYLGVLCALSGILIRFVIPPHISR